MQLSHAWLRQHLNISNTNNLAVISADGDSMAPTFSSGDLLLIDRQVDQIKTDAIYALAMDDQLYVKRLARDIGDGSVNIISDNPPTAPSASPAGAPSSCAWLAAWYLPGAAQSCD